MPAAALVIQNLSWEAPRTLVLEPATARSHYELRDESFETSQAGVQYPLSKQWSSEYLPRKSHVKPAQPLHKREVVDPLMNSQVVPTDPSGVQTASMYRSA